MRRGEAAAVAFNKYSTYTCQWWCNERRAGRRRQVSHDLAVFSVMFVARASMTLEQTSSAPVLVISPRQMLLLLWNMEKKCARWWRGLLPCGGMRATPLLLNPRDESRSLAQQLRSSSNPASEHAQSMHHRTGTLVQCVHLTCETWSVFGSSATRRWLPRIWPYCFNFRPLNPYIFSFAVNR